VNLRYTKTIMNIKKLRLERVLPWILIICGTIGLICAFIIAYEEFQLVQNPKYVPSCNLNPIISCGSVMASKQAQAFGIPNPWIGLMAFPVVITSGVAMLAGAKLKRWYMIGLQLGTVFGLCFVHWLFFETVYRIHALCPYCMIVWVMTITTFWYVLQYNLKLGYIKMPRQLAGFGTFLRKHHLDIIILWFLVIAALILKHFWYYYGKYL
jgi:uncharacterized membrane protein